MLDFLGAIGATVIYATLVGVLTGFSQASRRTKWIVFSLATLWGALIVAIASAGGFRTGTLGPLPVPVVAFTILLAALFGLWFYSDRFRNAIAKVPFRAMIAVNILRYAGVMFLLLQAQGRLSAPFAPSAGWGDILIASLAIPIALSVGRFPNGWIRAWNLLGILDLVLAVSFGVLSAPGSPLQIFTEGSGTRALSELPWVMIPTMIIPILLLIHLAIDSRLRAVKQTESQNGQVAVNRNAFLRS